MNKIYISGIGILNPYLKSINNIELINNLSRIKNQIIENDIIPEGLTSKELRNMSKLTKMSLYTAKKAFNTFNSNKSGIFFGLTHGSISMLKKFNDYIFNYGPDLASPICFSNGIPNSPLAAISTYLDIHDGGTTILGKEIIGFDLFELAYLSIINNEFKKTLIGASEELSENIISLYKTKTNPGKDLNLSLNKLNKHLIVETSAFLLVDKTYSQNSYCSCYLIRNLSEIASVDLIISSSEGSERDFKNLIKIKRTIKNNNIKMPLIFSKFFFGETFSVNYILSIILGAAILKNKIVFNSCPVNKQFADSFDNEYDPNTISRILIHSSCNKGHIVYLVLEMINID